MTYTALPTVSTGDLWTAAQHNTYIKDNFATLAADLTVKFIVNVSAGYNVTDTSVAVYSTAPYGVEMIDSKRTDVVGAFIVPSNYKSGLTVAPVLMATASGNLYWTSDYYYAQDNEDRDTHGASTTNETTAYTHPRIKVLDADTLSSAAVDDFVMCHFFRDATNAADTISASVYFYGFLVSYTGYNYTV